MKSVWYIRRCRSGGDRRGVIILANVLKVGWSVRHYGRRAAVAGTVTSAAVAESNKKGNLSLNPIP